jgi:GNAT superfamily N-acetyltransferase
MTQANPEILELIALNKNSDAEIADFACFVNQHYPSPLPIEEANIRSSAGLYFWARDIKNQERIGVTGYVPKTPYLAETVKTVIDPKFRGKGFGELLSEMIEEEVRRRGFKKVMSTIYITNLPMIFIKLKQGYLFEGFHPDHEKPGLHEYSLGKVLR